MERSGRWVSSLSTTCSQRIEFSKIKYAIKILSKEKRNCYIVAYSAKQTRAHQNHKTNIKHRKKTLCIFYGQSTLVIKKKKKNWYTITQRSRNNPSWIHKKIYVIYINCCTSSLLTNYKTVNKNNHTSPWIHRYMYEKTKSSCRTVHKKCRVSYSTSFFWQTLVAIIELKICEITHQKHKVARDTTR